jgi:hypothetical protein
LAEIRFDFPICIKKGNIDFRVGIVIFAKDKKHPTQHLASKTTVNPYYIFQKSLFGVKIRAKELLI